MAKYLGIPIALARGTSSSATPQVFNLIETSGAAFDGIKVGDIVVNTEVNPMLQATVTSLEFVSSGRLVISDNIFKSSSEDYAIFSPNDDTRGNVLMSIEGYIVARDIVGLLSVDFTQGGTANQQLFTPIGTPVTDSFLTKLYLRWLERLLVTNATSNRLDIPLNEFFNNSSNVPYYIKSINLQ